MLEKKKLQRFIATLRVNSNDKLGEVWESLKEKIEKVVKISFHQNLAFFV
jgi:hypothetical protein